MLWKREVENWTEKDTRYNSVKTKKNKLKEIHRKQYANYPINYHRCLKRNETVCSAVTHALEPSPYYVIKLVSLFLPGTAVSKATDF